MFTTKKECLVNKTKSLAKKIGIGALIIVPLAFLLSYYFAIWKMNNALAIFLIVLCCSIVCFAYVLIYNKIEQRKRQKLEKLDDPFNK